MVASALLLLVALVFIGCGGSSSSSTAAATSSSTTSSAKPGVNTTEVEQGISKSLSTSSVKITSADCPSNVPSSVGQTFTCSVKLSNGGTGDVVVTQTGLNSFSYKFKDGTVQVPGSTADTAIEKRLAAQGVPNAVVNCPSNIIVKVGTTVTCAVSSANGKTNGSVTFTSSSANGTVDSSSVTQTS